MKQILPFIFFLFISHYGIAQPNLRFYHLTREDGLSQSTVNHILEDNDGFFWFCTDDGVNKWNGYDFQNYTYEENNPNSLAQGRASVILQGKDSVIWVGSRQGGISKYIKEYDYFIVYQIEEGINEQNKSGFNYITSMVPFKNNLLVGTLDNGLHYFNKTTETFSLIKLRQKNGHEIPLPVEFRLYQSRDSIFWLAHSDGVLKVTNIIEEKPDKFTFEVEIFHQGNNVIAVYEDSNANLWIGTLESGAFYYNAKTRKKVWLEVGNPDGHHINSSIVRCFNEDDKGNLWIGTSGGGINIYNYKTEKIHYYLPEIGNKYAVNSNSIYYIYKARNTNLWIGTYNGGVSYTNWYKQSFNHIRSFGAVGDLNNNSILDFCETPDGKIWLGTDGGGINVLNPETYSHQTFDFSPNINIRVPKCLKTDKMGNIYIGTYRQGLFIYNYYSGKIQNISTTTSIKISCPDIWDIALSNNEENIWMASLGEGLIKYNRKKHKINTYRNHVDSLHSVSHNYLSVLMVDSKDNLWVGTFNAGISMLPNGKGNRFVNYHAGSISNISSNEVYAIYEDSKGNILVGTHEGGLNILNKETNKFVVYRHDNVLKGSTVYGIVEDNRGFVWLSTDEGLAKINVHNADSVILVKHFARKGLLSNEFNQHSTLKSSNGRLFFGGVNGYNFFDPEKIPDIESVGQTIISKVFVFDKPIEAIEFRHGLRDKGKGVVLEPWQTTLSFEYALMDYTLPEINTYKYQLIGFDKEWVMSGTRRRATYTNMDPGTYTFKVLGINSQGIEAKTPVTFTFTIQRPFYKTLIFKILVAITIAMLVFLVYKIRIRVYRRHEEQLKKMVGERTIELLSLNKVLEARNKEIQNSHKKIESQNSELEKHRNHLEEIVNERTNELEAAKIKAEESEQLKMAFLSNMSHEIRTPMNAILGFSSLLADEDIDRDEKENFINQINSNGESLLVLIDDILDLSKIEANQLQVIKSVFELNAFLNELFYNWQHLHLKRNSSIEISFSNMLALEKIYINSDAIRIRQIINNLLDNALKFTHQGKIELKLSRENEQIVIAVKDTGIGISKEFAPHIFNRFRKVDETDGKLYRGAGLGLTISSKLAALLGGVLSMESEKEIGSTFYLTFPASIISEYKFEKGTKRNGPADLKKLPSLKILVAEDEVANYIYLEKILVSQNAKVDWAQNGKEAVDMASKNQYDLILMDIKMPVMDGEKATQFIREVKHEQIIFAQTAFARPEEVEEFKKVGFNEYLTKPIKSEVLLEKIIKYYP